MIFFIISGFVVANTLRAPHANLLTFSVRRLFRLYPLFWFSIVMIVLFLQGKNELTPFVTDWKTVAANATMLPTLLGFNSLMIIYWTLETELVFYLVAAATFRSGWLFQPGKLLALIVVLIATFAAIMFGILPSPNSLSWKSLALNLAFMFWGSLFYVESARALAAKVPIFHSRLILLATAAILSPSIYTLIRFLATKSADDLRWAIAYPSALLIFSAVYFMDGRCIRACAGLGLISYSMYLLHPAAISMINYLINSYSFFSEGAHLPILSVGAIVVTIAISAIAYGLIERPFIRMGRKLTSAIAP